MYIRYNIHKTDTRYIADAAQELLRRIWEREQPIRLVFFGAAADSNQYHEEFEILRQIINNWYPNESTRPLFTYVAQRPLDCTLALETQNISKEYLDIVQFKSLNNDRYAIIEGERGEKMLMTQGLQASSLELSIKEQSEQVFDKLRVILEFEGMTIKSIDRQWNYIERITHCESGSQHYQDFNDARSDFYSPIVWASGYPAATGIGTAAGGVIVEVDAAVLQNTRTVALDNSLQVAAHEYSKEVLLGDHNQKTTPKFERARAIVYQSVFGDREALIYISGTAAIRGEQSLANVDIAQQTVATIENIEYLIGKQNLKKHGIELPKLPQIQNFRVYLKSKNDLQVACEIISRRYPSVPCLYVESDVCRDELLIEIEGLAE